MLVVERVLLIVVDGLVAVADNDANTPRNTSPNS